MREASSRSPARSATATGSASCPPAPWPSPSATATCNTSPTRNLWHLGEEVRAPARGPVRMNEQPEMDRGRSHLPGSQRGAGGREGEEAPPGEGREKGAGLRGVHRAAPGQAVRHH